jgi:hypothetical protein
VARRARHGIPLDREHVLRHDEIKASKACPGRIDVPAIISGAREWRAATTAPVAPLPPLVLAPRVLWSDYPAKASGGNGWIVATRVTSDTDWHFVPLAEIVRAFGVGVKARTPISQMKAEPGV